MIALPYVNRNKIEVPRPQSVGVIPSEPLLDFDCFYYISDGIITIYEQQKEKKPDTIFVNSFYPDALESHLRNQVREQLWSSEHKDLPISIQRENCPSIFLKKDQISQELSSELSLTNKLEVLAGGVFGFILGAYIATNLV